MRIKVTGIIASLGIVMFSGCANKVNDYSVSTENLLALKNLSKKARPVNVGEFTDSGKKESAVMCRLSSPVGTPEGKTFASYIQDAFKKELVITNMYNPKAKNTITANLNNISSSTLPANTYWAFDMTVKSSNGKSYNVKSRYDYESSYLASSACSEMQRSFPLAVQKLIHKIITDPRFPSLTK